MSPEMNNTFEAQVESEIRNLALDTLKTHPKRILEVVADSVDAIYVGKPEDDAPETKVAVMVALLRKVADSLENEENPMGFEFLTTEDGAKYRGRGAVKYSITKAVAEEYLIPSEMLARSHMNRVKRAARNAVK